MALAEAATRSGLRLRVCNIVFAAYLLAAAPIQLVAAKTSLNAIIDMLTFATVLAGASSLEPKMPLSLSEIRQLALRTVQYCHTTGIMKRSNCRGVQKC